MFASQLLRIFQTLPSDVKYQTSAFDAVEPEATMKENQSGTLCHSNGYDRDSERLALETNDKAEFLNTAEVKGSVLRDDFTNGNAIDASPLACGTLDKDDLSSVDNLAIQDDGFHRDADPLVPERNCRDELWNTPELECSVVFDDIIIGNKSKTEDIVEPCSISSELFEKDIDLYTDKNVTECELPELVVCYRESSYNVVKDICVDEGVPSEDKVLIGSGEGDHNKTDLTDNKAQIESIVPAMPSVSSEKGSDKEKLDVEFIPDRSSSASEVDIDQGSAKECDQMDPVLNGEAGKIIDDNALREDLAPNCMLSDEEAGKEKSQKSALESSNHELHDIEEQSRQPISCSENQVSESSNTNSAAEESNKNTPANNLEVDYDFDSTNSAVSSRVESPDNVHKESKKLMNKDDGSPDSLSAASLLERCEGDSSFSVSGGPVSYSGQIPYSGSISLRSDSSTTSTRSFAFPVLQTEWNSSPVRMVKADRRRYGKHKGWRQGLLCCKF